MNPSGIVIVQAYVDSENSFGAKLRSEFQIKYDSNKNYDGEVIKISGEQSLTNSKKMK